MISMSPTPYPLPAGAAPVRRDGEGWGKATARPNEVMLGTLLRRGAPGGEIARMFGLPPSAVAHMRDEIGI